MERVRFKCKVCGEYHDINKNTPAEFENWAYSKVEWSDFTDSVPPLSEEHWQRSETLPCVGETRIIKVLVTFDEVIGSEFYADYLTAYAFFNGHETEEQFENSAIVKCRFEEVVLSDEYNAWIKVTVTEVLPYHKIAELLPPHYVYEDFEDYGGSKFNDTENIGDKWRIISWSIQGDVGEIEYIFTDSKGIRHLVIFNQWMMSADVIYFGNVVKIEDRQTLYGEQL